MFSLYARGDGTSGSLGVKGITVWLNEHGYRTRKGATFGVGPVHGILTNRCYATGKWPYGVRSSRTRELHDPSTIVEIDVPVIIDLDLFEQVQARLAQNNPRVTPPRVVNGPTLLTGLASCATCGAGMTRTGTSRQGRSYSYYSCAGCHQKGKQHCKGRHLPMAKLDTLVLEGVADRVLVPQRVEEILGALIDRAAAKDHAVAARRHKLEAEVEALRSRISRLYLAIEEGVVELDDELKQRLARLKGERDLAQAALDQITANASARAAITPAKITAFTGMVREKLKTGDTRARKDWLGALISRVEVDDQAIRIIGSKTMLAATLTGQNGPQGNVRGFVRKWCTRQDSNLRPAV